MTRIQIACRTTAGIKNIKHFHCPLQAGFIEMAIPLVSQGQLDSWTYWIQVIWPFWAMLLREKNKRCIRVNSYFIVIGEQVLVWKKCWGLVSNPPPLSSDTLLCVHYTHCLAQKNAIHLVPRSQHLRSFRRCTLGTPNYCYMQQCGLSTDARDNHVHKHILDMPHYYKRQPNKLYRNPTGIVVGKHAAGR